MNDRVHAYLNGEISIEHLSLTEREQLRKMELALGTVVEHLRAAPVPDLTQRIMARLPEPVVATPGPEQAAGLDWKGLFSWVWTPWRIQLSVRPAYALAGVLLLALSLPLALQEFPGPGAHVAAVEEPIWGEAPPLYVQFRLDAPGANRVTLAGSFTQWQPGYELQETSPGVWTALVPLEPGVHDYAFIVDGKKWIADPHAIQVSDDFGGVNSRISLPPLHEST